MCGIVGYVGVKQCNSILMNGLKKLEYRGYDSVGIASLNEGKIDVVKKKGRVATIEQDSKCIKGNIGIGHTRWSTHGKPSDENSHPHYTQHFAVVHNGIIENYLELKVELVNQGVKFTSETDTGVVVHLLEKYYQGDFLSAVKQTLKRLCGSYAIAIICKDYPEEIIVAKKDNPLIIGLGDKEGFVASDIPALADYTNKIIYLQDGEFAEVKKGEAIVYNDKGIKIDREVTVVDVEKSQLSTAGYESFMLKEINEIPTAIEKTRESLQSLILPEKLVYMMKNTDLIKIIGCGTAYNSGLIGKQLFTKYARVRCEADIASEFRYNVNLIDDKTLIIAVSQSGETADTLAGVKIAKEMGAYVLLITNVANSSITHYADYTIVTKAGIETAVAATKSYNSQLVVFYYLAEKVAKLRGLECNFMDALKYVPAKIKKSVLDKQDHIIDLARKYHEVRSVFFLGRILDYAVAVEASLKLKEITYIHSEGYAGGELKHGTLALIDGQVLVVVLESQKELVPKMENALREVEARDANVLVATKDEKYSHCDAVILPDVDEALMPLIEIVPFQLFAYYVSRCRGQDADKPRNLAKSVTVE